MVSVYSYRKDHRLHDLDCILTHVQQKVRKTSSGDLEALFSEGDIANLVRSITCPSLRLLGVVPFEYLPAHLKNHDSMAKYKLKNAEYAPKVEVEMNILNHGTCPDTLKGFKNTLFNKEAEDYGKITSIYVDGQLIGAMKNVGNEIMLALKTKRSDGGTYPVIEGGLYTLSKTCQNRAKRERKWGKQQFPELKVKPISTLLRGIEKQEWYISHVLPEVYHVLRHK